MEQLITDLACRCGEVKMTVKGHPILNAECLCTDCQKAGKFLETLKDAPKVLEENESTRFVLYRKDKADCVKGKDRLKEYRLTDGSPTRRVLASCCNTPMFLEFTSGHWVSIYGLLWSRQKLPPLDLRTMTRSKPAHVDLDNNVPNPKTHTLKFYYKLFASWAAMGFKAPMLDFIVDSIDKES